MKNILKKITKFSLYISFVFITMLFINKVIFAIATLNKKLYDYNSYYYQWKFGKIHYTAMGSGKPILCIHSMKSGSSSYEFSKLTKQLAKNHTVYAIDLIGFGLSEKPKITYTAYMYVQLLHDFIKDVIQEDTDIITSGHSNSFVTMLSIQNSNYINKLIFINPGDLTKLSKNPIKKYSILKYILETPIIGTMLYLVINSKNQIKRQFKKSYFYNDTHISNKFIDSFYENSHIGDANNKFIFASNLCRYNNVNITTALEQINNSIYIIQGNERTEPFENIINEYKKANASIESSIIYKTKEFPHIEKPKAVLEVLSLYLS
ncbi:MAG: alpha/beta hydrolase [Firmicutes bacterium HGW-Firmicutes-1]|nr:MAG: alpha/beta hydrolase [Firmicutes bacterium HGW-Firmicutes-1]